MKRKKQQIIELIARIKERKFETKACSCLKLENKKNVAREQLLKIKQKFTREKKITRKSLEMFRLSTLL